MGHFESKFFKQKFNQFMKLYLNKMIQGLPLFLAIFLCHMTYAQKTVTGTVLDTESGFPLIGATVLIAGTDNGTVTDIDGKFSIEANEGAQLKFSYTGYAEQTITVGAESVIEVSMSASSEILDEVVVIGYGTVKKDDATGSIQTVSTESFNKGAITGPQELLAGKVPGVTISTGSGAPGEGATIRIRGESSLSANNDPLIVIDGVPLESGGVNGARNPLNVINPNDIETFTVLKDASATAIYGNRASGGVIIITTKKGKLGSDKINVGYAGNVSLSTVTNDVDVLSSDEFRSLINEQFDKDHPAVGLLGDANTFWQDEIYQTAFGQDHNLSFTGALKQIPYRVSLGYTSREGILKTDEFDRFTGSINLSPGFINNTLQIKAGLKFMSTDNRFANRGAIGSAVTFDPTKPVFDDETGGQFGGYYTWLQSNGDPNTLAPANPVALLEQRQDESNVNRFIGNFQVDYRFAFLPELRANLNLAYDRSESDGSVFVPQNAAFAFSNGGEDRTYTQEKKNELLEFYLNYVKDFGKTSLDLMAGYSWQHFFQEDFSQATNVDGSIVIDEPNRDPREYYLVSLFGRLNYSINSRYLFTFTLRRDGTSRFSEDNRYGIFPSAAFAWKIMDNSESNGLSNLKFRLGWGITGQQEIGGFYEYLPRYQRGQDNARYRFGNELITTLRPNGYDANIKWEETTTYNIGFNFGFLKNRITGTLDLYQRETEDLLNFVPVPAGTNLTNFITTNVGDLTNRGVELGLNTTPIQNNNVTWDLGVNVAYNENEITRLIATDDPNYQGVLTGGISGGVGSNIQINSTGFAPRSFFVFEQVYDEAGVPIEGLYVDRNGDGIVNNEDQYRLEKPDPDYSIGFTSRIAYKNIDLSFAGRSYIGNYNYNNVWSNNAVYEFLFNSTNIISNQHRHITVSDFQSPQYFSDYYVRDASFLRVDHITLGYNLNDVIGDFARFYVTVQNPFVISDYDGLDPEIFGGIDNNFYPRPRNFVFGVNVNF